MMGRRRASDVPECWVGMIRTVGIIGRRRRVSILGTVLPTLTACIQVESWKNRADCPAAAVNLMRAEHPSRSALNRQIRVEPDRLGQPAWGRGTMTSSQEGGAMKRSLALAALCVAILGSQPALAGPHIGVCRWLGFGWGPGYHANNPPGWSSAAHTPPPPAPAEVRSPQPNWPFVQPPTNPAVRTSPASTRPVLPRLDPQFNSR
jgi:hypothetical protein